jgi:integrase
VLNVKNPNGYGSVYKLSGKRRRPYVVSITVGGDGNGNMKRKILGTYADQATAKAALAEYNENKMDYRKIKIKLCDLYDEWKVTRYDEEGAVNPISKSTADNYKAAWKYMKPLYQMEVREIKTLHMQKIINDASADKSHSTLHKIRVLFGLLMKHAMQNDIVRKNYAEYLKLPAHGPSNKDRFNDMEIAAIERAAASGVPFADCVLMMCYTGFRISEFLSLTRFSYNPEENTLTGGIKTDAGKDRVVPVHPKIKYYLEKRLAQNGERIICKEDGTGYSTGYFRTDCYGSCLRMIGVRNLLPHECRHTFSSMLDNTSASDKTKASLAGHRDHKMDRDVYIHKTVPELREAINQMK